MAKFTEKPKTKKTINYMGEEAYNLNDKENLYSTVCTTFVQPSYYESESDLLLRIRDLVKKCNPEFVAKLAIYTREQMHLRSVPVVLVVELAKIHNGNGLVSTTVERIIQRPDEIVEILSYYQIANNRKGTKKLGKLSNQIRLGISNAFRKFDEYQLAKYNRKGDVTLKDALFITHPNPKDKIQEQLWAKLVCDELAVPVTWETELSLAGQHGESQKTVWEGLIEKESLGYMATLRNLRNMLQANVSKQHLDKVIKYLANTTAIQNSKQLPFRFLSAYEAIENETHLKFENDVDYAAAIRAAVNYAIEKSAELNIPKITGKTIIICDNSGSARGDGGGSSKISVKSVRTCADVGNLLGLLTWYSSENTIFGVFGDKLLFPKLDRGVGVLENFKIVDKEGESVGLSTEQGVFTMLQKMIDQNIQADRLIVCSDLQIGDGHNNEYGIKRDRTESVVNLLEEYRKKVNPNLVYYSVCFKGYGTNVVSTNKKNVFIAGWNDSILSFIKSYEDGKTVLKEIENIKL